MLAINDILEGCKIRAVGSSIAVNRTAKRRYCVIRAYRALKEGNEDIYRYYMRCIERAFQSYGDEL